MRLRGIYIGCILSLLFTHSASAEDGKLLPGINLPTAGYSSKAIPGRHGFNYLWPTPDEIQRFADAGFKVVRIAFLWERMQPQLNSELNEEEAQRLDLLVKKAEALGVYIVLDLHNYAAFQGNLIGSDQVSPESFAQVWQKLAERYKNYPHVIYGLMNEPNKQTTTEWAAIAQYGINAIRAAGAQQMIFVPGTKWSAAHSWTSATLITPSNAEALLTVKDPKNNLVFELHEYFDSDSSGTHAECVSADIAVNRFKQATEWLRKNQQKAFLGEFGVAQNQPCLNALESALSYFNENQDVWLGWTYWSASKWGGKYMFDIYSLDKEKQPQFAIIQKFLKTSNQH